MLMISLKQQLNIKFLMRISSKKILCNDKKHLEVHALLKAIKKYIIHHNGHNEKSETTSFLHAENNSTLSNENKKEKKNHEQRNQIYLHPTLIELYSENHHNRVREPSNDNG